MEGRTAMRLMMVFTLVVMTLLASDQHIVEGFRPGAPGFSSSSRSLIPFLDVDTTCNPADCEASCIEKLKEKYGSSQCVPIGEGASCVCFPKLF